jgi:hypothetical protein
VLPLVRTHDLRIEVFLVINEPQSWVRLTGGSHLGYEQLHGAQTHRPIKIIDTSEEDKT